MTLKQEFVEIKRNEYITFDIFPKQTKILTSFELQNKNAYRMNVEFICINNRA